MCWPFDLLLPVDHLDEGESDSTPQTSVGHDELLLQVDLLQAEPGHCWLLEWIFAPLVGEEGEDVDSDETDKEAENDRPQDKPNIPSTRADFLKDILSRYFFCKINVPEKMRPNLFEFLGSRLNGLDLLALETAIYICCQIHTCKIYDHHDHHDFCHGVTWLLSYIMGFPMDTLYRLRLAVTASRTAIPR